MPLPPTVATLAVPLVAPLYENSNVPFPPVAFFTISSNEVLEAVIACLKGEPFQLFPDFPTGGLVDVSEYEDGNGKVLVRAKLDTKDPKKIVIRELPFGTTTESLIHSIESAAKKNKIKIAGIHDYSAERSAKRIWHFSWLF